MPTYFCPDVTKALVDNGPAVCPYPLGPIDHPESGAEVLPSLGAGDVVLVVNFFGLGWRPEFLSALASGVEVIEDHTHDPWSEWAQTSQADWCVASLRKTMPLPDGGVLWSPRGHAPPHAPMTPLTHEALALQRFAAMSVKAMYLQGAVTSKAYFRSVMEATEARLVEEDPCGISRLSMELLPTFPLSEWRAKKKRNHSVGRELLCDRHGLLSVLVPATGDYCPLGVAMVFDLPRRRELVREQLIRQDIYPAVIWDLPHRDTPAGHWELSQRLLMVACDMRYGEADMARVADAVSRAAERVA